MCFIQDFKERFYSSIARISVEEYLEESKSSLYRVCFFLVAAGLQCSEGLQSYLQESSLRKIWLKSFWRSQSQFLRDDMGWEEQLLVLGLDEGCCELGWAGVECLCLGILAYGCSVSMELECKEVQEKPNLLVGEFLFIETRMQQQQSSSSIGHKYQKLKYPSFCAPFPPLHH